MGRSSRDAAAGAGGGRRRQGALALGAAAVGLPGIAAGPDPVALLAWLALVAPAVGALVGGRGLRFWPAGWIAPGVWAFLVVHAELGAGRAAPRASLGLAAVVGLYFLGLALGTRASRAPERLAGVLLVAGLALATAPVAGGLAEGGPARPPRHPALARALLDASPLVVVLESAGHDWTHAHPVVYARGGVEWAPRRSYRGALAAPVLLLVGSLLACLAQQRGGERPLGS